MTATENTIRFSVHTLDKATKAKVTLENYYSNLIAQHVERKQRYVFDILVVRCLNYFVIQIWGLTCLFGYCSKEKATHYSHCCLKKI